MTEDQLKKWQKKRDEAKRIEDPVARAAALDVVYDMKDDMQLDCQRKMADRIKELRSSDDEQSRCLAAVKSSVEQVERDFKAHVETCKKDHEVVEEFQARKHQAHGFMLALKWLGYLLAAGGGSAVTLLLRTVTEASR